MAAEGGDEDAPRNSCSSANLEGSSYEEQRLSRIRENQRRLEALGLPALASSLSKSIKRQQGPGRARKDRSRGDKDDDEYQPSDGEGEVESSSEEDGGGDAGASKSGSRRTPNRKRKNKRSLEKVKDTMDLRSRKNLNMDDVDEDATFQQAIALSLEGSLRSSEPTLSGSPQGSNTKLGNTSSRERKGGANRNSQKEKKKNLFTSRAQMAEDEVVAYFFSFDEAGKGYITVRDLQQMAITHDFIWREKEIVDMIQVFDSDRDGKLNLEEFRAIVCRCNMIQPSENP
ncbi:Calcium-dependent protein kinase 3 [Acorus gramineus]|uniref:Calcium-dependent protein kinase 3 n=1 Tax=Acorus gramineus TaxID=55184 RepID=A0AAV9AEC7_ACOGR|nr:Calcium-dependent protein kinase 3 [Acorus gramineus]